MNKLVLLPLLILPACAVPGEDGRQMRAALDHDQALCTARGNQLGTDGYRTCMQALGRGDGYVVAAADNGDVAFHLPTAGGIPNNPAGGAPAINSVPPALQRPR